MGPDAKTQSKLPGTQAEYYLRTVELAVRHGKESHYNKEGGHLTPMERCNRNIRVDRIIFVFGVHSASCRVPCGTRYWKVDI